MFSTVSRGKFRDYSGKFDFGIGYEPLSFISIQVGDISVENEPDNILYATMTSFLVSNRRQI